MDLLIKLLLAHLFGDFIFQPTAMRDNKRKRYFKSVYLYVHGIVHGGLAFLILWDWHLWPIAVCVTASHILIDGAQASLLARANDNNPKERLLFFADQLAHLLVLATLSHYYKPVQWLTVISYASFFPHFLFVVFLTKPTSTVIQKIFLRWKMPDAVKDSLPGAGAYIGVIERLMVYGAVVTENWSMVGFLLAAKSVFRYGDMREAQDRKYTEYIFIGTLLSFAFAIASGILLLALKN